jgi:hypothetical protein
LSGINRFAESGYPPSLHSPKIERHQSTETLEATMGMVRRRTRRRTMMVAGGLAYERGRRQQAADDSTYADPGDNQEYAEPAPQAPPPAPPAPAPTQVDTASEIERLAALHDSGALSDDEFAAMKQKLISA